MVAGNARAEAVISAGLAVRMAWHFAAIAIDKESYFYAISIIGR